jgi:hypothetical protein
VSSVAARIAAFFWCFAGGAAVAGGTARSRALRSCVPSGNGRHVGGISRVPKDASIIATAIRNFGDCSEMPRSA